MLSEIYRGLDHAKRANFDQDQSARAAGEEAVYRILIHPRAMDQLLNDHVDDLKHRFTGPREEWQIFGMLPIETDLIACWEIVRVEARMLPQGAPVPAPKTKCPDCDGTGNNASDMDQVEKFGEFIFDIMACDRCKGTGLI